jgi:hypothetical protein
MHDYWRAQRQTGGWSGPWGGYGPWGSWGGGWWGGGSFWAAVLIVIGLYYLLQNLGLLVSLPGDILWPSLLILFGLWLLLRRSRWWP